MTAGIKANSDGSAAIQVGGTDVITLTSGGAATFVTSPTTVQAGTAAAPSITFSGRTNTGIYSPAANTLAFSTSGAEVARFDSAGNMGIGTSSPTNPLQVNGNIVSSDGTTFNRMTRSGGVGLFGTTSNHPIAFQTNDTERMRIDASGNVGIGTSSPSMRLDVQAVDGIGSITSTTGTNTVNWRLTNSGGTLFTGIDSSTGGNFTGTAYAGVLWHSGNYPIVFATNNTMRARITASGQWLLGTTSAAANYKSNNVFSGNGENGLLVQNIASSGGPAFLVLNDSAQTLNNTGDSAFYNDSTTTRWTLRKNGGLANYQANNANLSDRREKTNFAPAKNYLDVICAIPVQTFNYIDQAEDDPGLTLGVVAQDVEAVAPELVMESDWSTEKDGSKVRLSIYQTDLQYALMKCIQELKAELDATKAKVAALEGA